MGTTLTRRGLCAAAVAGLGLAALAGARGARGAQPARTTTVELRRGYTKTFEDECFTQSVVVLVDGVIAAARIDDYTYVEDGQGYVPVPCSGEGFGAGSVEGAVLVSKRANNELYSDAMSMLSGASQTWLASVGALERYAVGKRPEELYGVDVVSGCTFVSPDVYLIALAQTAQNPYLVSSGTFAGEASELSLGCAEGAGYAGDSFGSAAVAAADGKTVAANYDAFCYLPFITPGVNSLPNSDAALGTYYADDMVLASKALNNQGYSAIMASRSDSKQDWKTSVAYIEQAVAGLDARDTAQLTVDTVSGSTLLSTDLVAQTVAAALEEACMPTT